MTLRLRLAAGWILKGLGLVAFLVGAAGFVFFGNRGFGCSLFTFGCNPVAFIMPHLGDIMALAVGLGLASAGDRLRKGAGSGSEHAAS